MRLADIKTVAILGAGTMGQGIAQVCAMAGFRTLLFDIEQSRVHKGLLAIRERMQQAMDKGKLSNDQKRGAEGNLAGVTQLTDIRADLIIEAVVEKLDVKQKLFQELEVINEGMAILATNTSSLSVTKIGSSLNDPRRCVGLHFFNPADRMKLVEIIAGAETSQKCVDLMKQFSVQIEKTAVIAADSPGFIVNRVARHYYLESLKLLEEQAASAEEIDRLLKSAGFKMGPFELMDLIGVDINYAVTLSTYEAFNQAHRFKPSKIQQQKVEAGHLGRKSGKGFYDY